MTGMRAARARARARAVRSLPRGGAAGLSLCARSLAGPRRGPGYALALSRGRGGAGVVRSLPLGDAAGPSLCARSLAGARRIPAARSLPGEGLGASLARLRPCLSAAPGPLATHPRVGLRASVPAGAAYALGNSAPSRALRGPLAPRAPTALTAPVSSPTRPTPCHPLPCRAAKPLPISPRPSLESSRGPGVKDSTLQQFGGAGALPAQAHLLFTLATWAAQGGSLAELGGVVSLSPYLSLERNKPAVFNAQVSPVSSSILHKFPLCTVKK